MTDEHVLTRIEELEGEEQRLRSDEGAAAGEQQAERIAADADALRGIRAELGRQWDYLRQRRALRSAGENPDDAELRDADTVQGYLG